MLKKNVSKVARNTLPDFNSKFFVHKDYDDINNFYTSNPDVLRGAQGRDGNWIDPRQYLDMRNNQLICEDESCTANMPDTPIMRKFWTN